MSLHKMLRAAAGYQAPAPANTDPQFNYVSMLLHGDGTNGSQNNTFVDSSTNNFTITRNGNTTQGSLSPYGSLWSNFFDGTGDYLTVPDNAAFDLAASDWTVETWFNFRALPVSGDASSFVSQWKSSAPTSLGWFFYLFNNAGTYQLYLSYSTTGSNQTNLSVNLSSAPSLGTWNHVAFVRSGTNFLVFLNGVQVGSTQTLNATIFDSTTSVWIGAQEGGNYLLNGSLSNLRIVKGTALYTSAFTPSTTPLTAVSGTSLLTCQSNRFIDNSANNFTITRNGDVRVTKESPFLPTAAYSTSTIGGSGYFDGNGDWLQVPSSSAFNIATSTTPFTIEAWIYPTTTGGALFSEIYTGSGTVVVAVTMSDGSLVQNTNGRYIAFGWFDGTNWITAAMSSSQVSLNSWSHVAVVFTGSTSKIFVNGVDVTKSSSPTPATSWGVTGTNGDGCYIGRRWDTFADIYFTGYISNLRVVNGTAVYTTTFTPPTAPVTAITNTSLLLNFTNAGIFDNAAENVLETVGNAQISTSVKKYGTGSLAFDGTGDWLAPNDALPYTFGSGDFTVEFWLYLNSTQTSMLYDGRPVSGVGATPTIYVASNVLYYFTNNANRITGSTLSNTTWTHVALCKSGGNTRLFVNGTQVGSTYADSVTYTNTAGRPLIGASGETVGQFPLNGYIDDLRITKGYARYTANFTPPTAAFPDQ